jgi:hypothetical protein
VNVVDPDFPLTPHIKVRSEGEESRRPNESASRYHRGLTLPNFREADQFAGGEWEISRRRIQGAQIIFIENSDDAPWLREGRDATSLESPDKRLAPPAQPGINQPALAPEPNSPIPAWLHKSEREAAASGTELGCRAEQIRNHGLRQVHEQSFRDPKSSLSRIETRFVEHCGIDLARTEIGGDKMKSAGVNIPRYFRLASLRRWMINLPKTRGAKFPMERQSEWIEARAKNDDLGNCVLKCFARKAGEAFFSQRIMAQDSGDGVLLDEFHQPEEPRPASKSEK